MGEGEMGRGNGDFGAATGMEMAGTERESLGLAVRSILSVSKAKVFVFWDFLRVVEFYCFLKKKKTKKSCVGCKGFNEGDRNAELVALAP